MTTTPLPLLSLPCGTAAARGGVAAVLGLGGSSAVLADRGVGLFDLEQTLMPAGVAAAAVPVALACALVSAVYFAWRLCGLYPPRVLRALALYAVVTTLLVLPLWPWTAADLLLPLCALDALLATGLLMQGGAAARRQRVTGLGWLFGAAWLALGCALHDLLRLAGLASPYAGWLLPFAALPLCAAFMQALQHRCSQALARMEQAQACLVARLRERQGQLETGLQQLRAAERQQAVHDERQRLTRDMHDGVGSALMSALVLVEQGRLDLRGVAGLLRECMDDIRLVIDSMEPVDQDLVALLASLRYRLGRRLELAGMRLIWQVGEVPRLDWLDAGAALQILRIVQEVLANVIKHAGAGSVSLVTGLHDDGARRWVRVRIVDDGCGFDAISPAAGGGAGRGLRNLRSRARALQAHLTLRSRPGRTEVTLDLPVSLAGPGVGAAMPLSVAAAHGNRVAAVSSLECSS